MPTLESKKQELKQLRDQAQEAIKHAQHLISLHNQRHKKKGKFTPFTLGQKVWLKGTNLRLSHPSAKLAPRRYGPFQITKVLSPVVYQLGLPPSWKIFNTFHASLLSPYHETQQHGPNYIEPPPDLIDGEEEYEVEEVLNQRTHGRGKKKQYLIKWKGYSPAHNSWEDAVNVHTPVLITKFQKKGKARDTQIAVLKGSSSSSVLAMSSDSAPSLPSPELYSLTHYLWYNGSEERTTPEPKEKADICDQEGEDVSADDDASFITAPSRSPSTHGAGSPRDPARAEDIPQARGLWDAAMASGSSLQDGQAEETAGDVAAPSRHSLSPLSTFTSIHGLDSSLGRADPCSQ
jgi:hypothetical protein